MSETTMTTITDFPLRHDIECSGPRPAGTCRGWLDLEPSHYYATAEESESERMARVYYSQDRTDDAAAAAAWYQGGAQGLIDLRGSRGVSVHPWWGLGMAAVHGSADERDRAGAEIRRRLGVV